MKNKQILRKNIMYEFLQRANILYLSQFSSLTMCLGKHWRMAQAFGPVTHLEDLNRVSGSWLQPGSAPITAASLRVNQQMENYFCPSAFQVNKHTYTQFLGLVMWHNG